MPARIRKIRHDDQTRLKIQASQIINRLQDHFHGRIELSTTQIKCAEILLRKVLPDLAMVEHSGEVNVNYAEVPQVLSEEEWLKKRAIVSGEPSPDRNLH